jgi:hypothetical protein
MLEYTFLLNFAIISFSSGRFVTDRKALIWAAISFSTDMPTAINGS